MVLKHSADQVILQFWTAINPIVQLSTVYSAFQEETLDSNESRNHA